MTFKEQGILLNATFVESEEYNLINWAAALIRYYYYKFYNFRNGQLWIVIYRLDVFESLSSLELIGKKCVGDYHPLHLISLPDIPGTLALITVYLMI